MTFLLKKTFKKKPGQSFGSGPVKVVRRPWPLGLPPNLNSLQSRKCQTGARPTGRPSTPWRVDMKRQTSFHNATRTFPSLISLWPGAGVSDLENAHYRCKDHKVGFHCEMFPVSSGHWQPAPHEPEDPSHTPVGSLPLRHVTPAAGGGSDSGIECLLVRGTLSFRGG